MSKLRRLALVVAIGAAACSSADDTASPPSLLEPTEVTEVVADDSAQDTDARAEALLQEMTLGEKVGQMTLVDRSSITPQDVEKWAIGAVLSGGGSAPTTNTVPSWAAMVDDYQRAASQTRLAIPIIYGIDAVHGNGNVYGATLFPHNIGLGAADDPTLVERIARVTALEMAATGITWSYSPVVAVPQDIRWGRTYEAYSEDPAIVARLGAAHVRGLQGATGTTANFDAVATAKHFIGDGAAEWGTSTAGGTFVIDQGTTRIDEKELRERHLPPYQTALDAGARTIMVSFSSWNGTRMHANDYLLTDVLKGELGFDGVVVSDWAGIDQIPGEYGTDVVTAINAGIDMVMVPHDYATFINDLTAGVEGGLVSESRIDDATLRILRLKLETGLFEQSSSRPELASMVGSAPHRALAREAVQRSLVLLKNDDHVLPLDEATPRLLVAGVAADDVGLQSGGWTITHQGQAGDVTPGTTILDGITRAVGAGTAIQYDPAGRFEALASDGQAPAAEVGIVVLAEPPYAEGAGDRADLSLPPEDVALLARVRPMVGSLVVVLLSGRPLVVTEQLSEWDAFVVAWLPGTEGDGVTDVLFGAAPFTGRLPYTWPRWNAQLPLDAWATSTGCDGPLFPLGFGLSSADPSPPQLACPAP